MTDCCGQQTGDGGGAGGGVGVGVGIVIEGDGRLEVGKGIEGNIGVFGGVVLCKYIPDGAGVAFMLDGEGASRRRGGKKNGIWYCDGRCMCAATSKKGRSEPKERRGRQERGPSSRERKRRNSLSWHGRLFIAYSLEVGRG